MNATKNAPPFDTPTKWIRDTKYLQKRLSVSSRWAPDKRPADPNFVLVAHSKSSTFGRSTSGVCRHRCRGGRSCITTQTETRNELVRRPSCFRPLPKYPQNPPKSTHWVTLGEGPVRFQKALGI